MNATQAANLIRILHVDDDPGILEVSKQILQLTSRFEITTAQSVDDALSKMQTTSYDAIISDYEMPQKNGLQFLKELRENNNQTPFILFTGKGREEVVISALNLGADAYINKIGNPETVYGELAHNLQLVVDRNKTKQELQESEKRYRALMEQASISIIVHDIKGNIIDANQKTLKDLQYTKQELTKMSILDINPNKTPEQSDMWNKVIQGQTFTFQTTAKCKDQTIIPIEGTLGPVKIGQTTLIMSVVQNLRERQKDQEKLQKSEEKYRRMIELSPDGIITASLTGTITSINKAFCTLTGYNPEEIVGKHFTKIGTLKLNDLPSYLKVFSTLIAGKTPRKLEFPYITKDGVERIAEAHFVIMKEDNQSIGLQAILRDITELKEATKTAKEKETILNLLLETSLLAKTHLDLQEKITLINRKACQTLNKEPQDLIGKTIREIYPPQKADLITQRLKEAKKTSQNKVYEDLEQTPNGQKWFRSTYNRIVNQQGKMIGLQIISDDITEKKTTEQELRKTTHELQIESEKLKHLNEKLQIIGKLTRHDLNNKLAAIKAQLYLIDKTLNNNPQAKTQIQQINTTITNAEHLLNLSTTYSEIGNQNLTPTNVEATFNKTTKLFPELRTIKIENKCQNLTVNADPQLEQLFYNLIDNSLKHGQTVTNIRLSYKKEKHQITLIYEDNGIGIPQGNKPKIFKEGFSTANSSGHGLHLIQKIAQGYGWTINEEGPPNKGAKFTLTIPQTST